tara:strand:- start:889 stop:1206 length:318 start_codon:yes stop_codon:yes gene_type:complete
MSVQDRQHTELKEAEFEINNKTYSDSDIYIVNCSGNVVKIDASFDHAFGTHNCSEYDVEDLEFELITILSNDVNDKTVPFNSLPKMIQGELELKAINALIEQADI